MNSGLYLSKKKITSLPTCLPVLSIRSAFLITSLPHMDKWYLGINSHFQIMHFAQETQLKKKMNFSAYQDEEILLFLSGNRLQVYQMLLSKKYHQLLLCV